MKIRKSKGQKRERRRHEREGDDDDDDDSDGEPPAKRSRRDPSPASSGVPDRAGATLTSAADLRRHESFNPPDSGPASKVAGLLASAARSAGDPVPPASVAASAAGEAPAM